MTKTEAPRHPGPLDGMRVLDLTVAMAGPYCTLMLGGLGAEVIKIEPPRGNDIARTNPPFVGEEGLYYTDMAEGDLSVSILNRARCKRSVTLDLKSQEGRAMFMDMVRESDIVVENLADGVVERLGIDYESVRAVNPRIIYGSVTGLGRPSPLPGLKVVDIMIQALSGVMDVTGETDGPPMRFGLPIADLLAPLYGTIGILAAVKQRDQLGIGQHVVVSMLECLSSLLPFEHFDLFRREGFPPRSGNFQNRIAPFGIYPTQDGHVAIAAASDKLMASLSEAMGQPDLMKEPRFKGRGERARNADALNKLISAWTTTMTNEQAIELMRKHGVLCAPVRSIDEVMVDPFLREQRAIETLVHPQFGPIDAAGPGLPIHFSEARTGFDKPAEPLGKSTDAVCREMLKIDEDRLKALKSRSVI